MRALSAIVCAFALTVFTLDASAADGVRSRVVIARSKGASSAIADVSRRLSAELTAAGFDVVIREDVNGATPEGEEAPFAAWIVLGHAAASDTASVFVKDPRTATARVADANDVDGSNARAALALRTVEILRASLLDLAEDDDARRKMAPDVAAWTKAEAAPEVAQRDEAAAPPPPPKPPIANALKASYLMPAIEGDRPAPAKADKPEPAEVKDPNDHQWWVGGAFSSIMSYGDLGVSVGPRIAVERELPGRFGLGAALTGVGSVHTDSVNALQILGVAYFTYTIGRPTWVVSPHLGGGLGFHAYRSTEDVAASELTVPGWQGGFGFAMTADLGINFNLASWARIKFEGSAFAVLPEPTLQSFGGFEGLGAHFPMFTNSIGLELSP